MTQGHKDTKIKDDCFVGHDPLRRVSGGGVGPCTKI